MAVDILNQIGNFWGEMTYIAPSLSFWGVLMANVTQIVKERVEEDPVVREALDRGIVNYRALARWLIQSNEWEASEESVMTALRRCNPKEMDDAFASARRALSSTALNTRSRMCSLQLRTDPRLYKHIPSLFKAIDYSRGDTLRIISSDRGLKIIVDQRNLEKVTAFLDEDSIEHIRGDLTELSMLVPPESWETPGVLALLCNRLALKGINMAGIVDGINQLIVLIDEKDSFEAYHCLAELSRPTNGTAAGRDALKGKMELPPQQLK